MRHAEYLFLHFQQINSQSNHEYHLPILVYLAFFEMREKLPKIYSQDLLNNIFRHPYTKIEFVISDLNVSRITATRYLEEMVKIDIVEKEKYGKENYYINTALFDLLTNRGNDRSR